MIDSDTACVRRRRWPRRLAIIAAVFAACVLVLVAVVAFFLQPARLTTLLLSRAGTAMKLDLRTSGPGTFALRPEVRLVLPGLSATLPGERKPFFSSKGVELAVPWRTLRGKDDAVSRIALKSPDIDLRGLQRWQATQPPSTQPVKLPTLTHGLSITDATLRGAGWRIERFDLDVPKLADGKPATYGAQGDLVRARTISHFALQANADIAGAGQGLRIDGLRLTFTGDGELPSLTATGHLLASDAIDIALNGQLQRIPAPWPARLDSAFAKPGDTPYAVALVHEPAAVGPGKWRLKIALGDAKRQPTLNLNAHLDGELMLDAGVNAQLSRWPDAWPGLPAGLGKGDLPVQFSAAYKGPILPPAPFVFTLLRGDTRLQGQAKFDDLRAWVRAGFTPMLPPVQATLDTPALALGGVTLQGVHAQVSDDPPASSPGALPKANGKPQP